VRTIIARAFERSLNFYSLLMRDDIALCITARAESYPDLSSHRIISI